MVLLKDLFEEALKKPSNKKRRKKSNRKNETGLYRVSKGYCRSCKEKTIWQYVYINSEGKRKYIGSVSLLKLKEKIKDKKLEWKINNEYYANKTAKELGLALKELR